MTPLTLTPQTRRMRRFDDLRWHVIDVQQSLNTGVHQIFIDETAMVLTPTNFRRIAQIRGRVFLG